MFSKHLNGKRLTGVNLIGYTLWDRSLGIIIPSHINSFGKLPLAVLTVFLSISMLTAPAIADPNFTDVTVAAGVDYDHCSTCDTFLSFPIIIMIGGAAAGDYDNDGWTDLFVTRPDDTDILFRNKGIDGGGNHLGFEDVSAAAGFTDVLHSNGAAWGDIDNDGDLDLYVTSVNDTRFYLYINDANGHFTEEAIARGAAVDGNDIHYGFGATWGDYDRDGYIDLHVEEWRQDSSNPTNAPPNTKLLRNNGKDGPGTFTDVTYQAGVEYDDIEAPLPGRDGSFAFLSRFSDLDRDGWPDLMVIADFEQSRLFWNNRDGTFTDGTEAAHVNTGQSEMGATLADYDGDGDLDLFVSAIGEDPDSNSLPSLFPDGNRLYRNEGDRTFTDVTDAAGVRDTSWSWGTSFLDYDNDRDPDLVVTNGWTWGLKPTDRTVLFQNNNGVFTDVSYAANITDRKIGTGLLVFDYDNDGDLDIFIVNNQDHPVLYRNDGGNDNDWLRIKTVGTVSNRDGFGAFITVQPDIASSDVLVWEVNSGNNYLGQNEPIAHFGLGASAGTVDLVTIEWPSGHVQVFNDVAPNTLLVATEPGIVCEEWLHPSPYPVGDYDKNCRVDLGDLAFFIMHWMECTVNCI